MHIEKRCCLCQRVSTQRRTGPAISGTLSATLSQPHGLAQPRSKTILYCAYSLIGYCLASLPFEDAMSTAAGSQFGPEDAPPTGSSLQLHDTVDTR